MNRIGIRRENKNKWERRAPLAPQHVKQLFDEFGACIDVQPSRYRIFDEALYRDAGATITEDLKACKIIAGVKEVPEQFIEKNKVYLIFSHTIKGQPYNMGKLQRFLDQGCTLIDYECIVDERGRRLVFFGRFAGLAGMLETLYAMGKRLHAFHLDSAFNDLHQAFEYDSLDAAKAHVKAVGERIRREGLPKKILPFVAGFAGYGNVSRGAQEIFDLLPVEEVKPQDVPNLPVGDGRVVYKVVYKESDTVAPIDGPRTFSPKEYFEHPERFRSIFEKQLPYLNILINGVYWDDRYPRLVTKKYVHENAEKFRILVIGDISCDINGSIEITEKVTEPDASFYVYEPASGTISDDPGRPGIGIMAIDNLPSELPAAATTSFGDALFPFMTELIKTDFSVPFQDCDLPPELKKATLVYNGQLTPQYTYLKKFLQTA